MAQSYFDRMKAAGYPLPVAPLQEGNSMYNYVSLEGNCRFSAIAIVALHTKVTKNSEESGFSTREPMRLVVSKRQRMPEWLCAEKTRGRLQLRIPGMLLLFA